MPCRAAFGPDDSPTEFQLHLPEQFDPSATTIRKQNIHLAFRLLRHCDHEPAMVERRRPFPAGQRLAFFGHTSTAPFPWARCLVPGFDGAFLSHDSKDALWDKFYTAAPPRRRQSVEQYKIVKRA